MTANMKTISDYVEVRGRFKRSTNLEKDFAAAYQNGEYIITPMAREALRRLAEGIANGSPFRAWTLTGPYGVGKSAFAVFLTQLLCEAGQQSKQARSQLEQVDPLLKVHLRDLGLFRKDSKGFLPVLATARRTSAAKCLAEGIIAATSSVHDQTVKSSVKAIEEKLKSQQNGQAWDTRQIVDALASLSKAATLSGYQGVLLIVDELGKLFEYAARYPQKGDVFVLQELAEHAARSSTIPIILVGLLHQSFQEYGLHLDIATRREWAKIQGRFEDIAFVEPAEQVIRMIAQAIRRNENSHTNISSGYAAEIAAIASKAGIAPPGIQPSDFEDTARAAYPLHPVTLVALPFIFRRFAQNERSLFSYLSSLEPNGFQEFIKIHEFTPDNPPTIRLGNLFDYFTRSFGTGLYRHSHALRWMEAADVLERNEELSPLHREVVKTIGVLNALGEFCHLNATEEVVSLAISDSAELSSELRAAMASLREASIITYRKFNNTYRIWEGSDVDIEERVSEGKRRIRQGLNLADSVKRYLPTRPLVARRHSFETGALRYFHIEYVDNPDDIQTHLNLSDTNSKVMVCLAESSVVAEKFCDCAINASERRDVLFAVPQLIGELRAVVSELGALRWAWDNTPELRDDRVARREISLRITEVDQLLQRNVDGLLDPRDEPAGSGCLWIHNGQAVPVHSPVDVSQLLSDVFDEIYDKTPRIRNELIARRVLSSAAAAARRNLIDRMLNRHAEEALGMEGYPPERSMYESVLKATGLHRQDQEGNWGFKSPGDRNATKIVFVWNCIRDALFERQPEPIPLTDLFSDLEAPPYGVMPGLHPVLLCAFMLAHPDETTLYREGTFLPEPGIADFEVLMRRPDLFAIAGSRILGERAAVVERLAKGLNVNPATVPVVRALFRMVKMLPDFAWNTRRLPETTKAMRDSFQNAKSPEQFLFVALPKALHLPVFSEEEYRKDDIKGFFETLNSNLRNLSEATSAVINNARDILLKACGFNGGDAHWPELRNTAVALEPVITEPHLLTFLKRVTQSGADASGVESVLALVSNRPPRNWTDADVDRFPKAATAIGKVFRDAARLRGVVSDSNVQLAALTPKERRQVNYVLDHFRKYLRSNVGNASPRAVRTAVICLLEELSDE